jgi:hypothetical protein
MKKPPTKYNKCDKKFQQVFAVLKIHAPYEEKERLPGGLEYVLLSRCRPPDEVE